MAWENIKINYPLVNVILKPVGQFTWRQNKLPHFGQQIKIYKKSYICFIYFVKFFLNWRIEHKYRKMHGSYTAQWITKSKYTCEITIQVKEKNTASLSLPRSDLRIPSLSLPHPFSPEVANLTATRISFSCFGILCCIYSVIFF